MDKKLETRRSQKSRSQTRARDKSLRELFTSKVLKPRSQQVGQAIESSEISQVESSGGIPERTKGKAGLDNRLYMLGYSAVARLGVVYLPLSIGSTGTSGSRRKIGVGVGETGGETGVGTAKGKANSGYRDRRFQTGALRGAQGMGARDRDLFLGIDDIPVGSWLCLGIGEKRTRGLVTKHKKNRYRCSFSAGFCNALVDRYRREMGVIG